MQTRKRTTLQTTLLSYPELRFNDPLTKHVLNTFGQQPRFMRLPELLDEIFLRALICSDWTKEERQERHQLIERLRTFVISLDESRPL